MSSSPIVTVPGFTIISSHKDIVGKKVICFSPHPDDTSISAGATLALLSGNNDVISCVATTGHRAYIPGTNTAEERIAIREKEASAEAAILGARINFLRLPLYNRGSIVEDSDILIMEKYLETEVPDLIIMPQTGDTHQTHRAVAKAILLAVQRYLTKHKSLEIWMYEGPWSLFSKGAYNLVCSPPEDTFSKKLAAIKVHVSQTARTAYDRAADSLAQLRGALVPEQDLGGWGGDPPELGQRLELFYKVVVKTSNDLQIILKWLSEEVPPRKIDALKMST